MSSSAPTSAERWGEAAGRYPLLTGSQELHFGAAIRAWQDHPDGPDDCPAPVRRRGLRARERMVGANLRLVCSIARRRWHPGDGRLLEDLLQDGALGLVRAAEKYDPARGYKFSTYAYWWILQGINRSRGRDRMIKVPVDSWAKLHDPENNDPGAMAARAALAVGSLDAPLGADDPRPLAEAVAGGSLQVESLEWPAALEAAEGALTADDWALLQLRVEGHNCQALADLTASRADAVATQLRKLRSSLRGLPEVQAVMVA